MVRFGPLSVPDGGYVDGHDARRHAPPTRPRRPRPTGTASSRRLADEHDYVVDEIDGHLPDGLIGTLYRNGPGKNEVGGKPYAHLFDGDGLLSQFAFDGTQRPLPQPLRAHDALPRRARRGQAASCATTASSGRAARSATRSACRRTSPTRASSTTPATCSRSTRAAARGQLDPDTLETIGEYDYDGELKASRTRTPPTRPGTRPPASSSTSGSSTGRARSCAPTGSTARGKLHHLHAINLPVRDDQPRLRADAKLHGVRDRPARRCASRASCSGSRASTASLRFDRSKADAGHPRPARRRQAAHRGVRAVLPLPHQQRVRRRRRRRARPGPLPRLRQHPPRLSRLPARPASTTLDDARWPAACQPSGRGRRSRTLSQ